MIHIHPWIYLTLRRLFQPPALIVLKQAMPRPLFKHAVIQAEALIRESTVNMKYTHIKQ